MSGTLYLVATPIGNLGDFSPRAVETLQNADGILSGDSEKQDAKTLSAYLSEKL